MGSFDVESEFYNIRNAMNADTPKRQVARGNSSSAQTPASVPSGSPTNENTQAAETVREEQRAADAVKNEMKTASELSKIRNERIDKQRSEFVQIRNFPRDLMAMVRAEFPDAKNQSDALAAYISVKTNFQSSSVSDEVRDLISTYDGDRTAQNTEKRLSNLERQMREILRYMQESELVLSYLTFDKLGYRRENPKDARSIDFLENGVEAVIARIREQTAQYVKQENIRNGRPQHSRKEI